jgi:glycosyltransferase involved in cell wall biosynthesis
VKVALVTTPPSVRSGIGDYTRHLLPYLAEHCDLEAFVETGADEPGWPAGIRVRTLEELVPRAFDQIVYQVGNEANHAFMPRMIRAVGGTVVQHDWVLFDLAVATFPALVRGGPKGHLVALREGGLAQARVYARNWLRRRRQRLQPADWIDASSLPGSVLAGWHFPEERGRWTADQASFRIPARGVQRIRVELHAEPGRTVRLHHNGEVLGSHARPGDGELVADPGRRDRPLLTLVTEGIVVTPEQRRHGDCRRLGTFVRRVSWKDEAGEHELDLAEPAAVPVLPVTLSRDRFLLPFNRSVVRMADAFLVHSRYVRDLVLRERNSSTPIGVVHHGAERRWRDEDRREVRQRLGLSADWIDAFVVVSFGGVQPHKRVDKALAALAESRRERSDIRLVLAGSIQGDGFDPAAAARRLGLESAVHFTG